MSKQSELNNEWQSWRPLIKSDLEKAQNKLMTFHKYASAFSSKKERNKFLEEELMKLVREVCNLE